MEKPDFSEIKGRTRALIKERFIDRLGKRKIRFFISAGICLALFFVLHGITIKLSESLDEQNMSARWAADGGYAQISCFFSSNAEISAEKIEELEHTLDSALLEASIENEDDNGNDAGRRLFVYAYSADGVVEIESEHGKLKAKALGVGGDFFLFHRLKLKNGSFFSGNDVMQDFCIIDEDAAWQLFGSSDVVGQMVTVGGTPHIISGVIDRAEDKLSKAAGLSETLVYVSCESLSNYGTNNGINHYEICMPNPVSNYAYNLVKDKLKIDDKYIEIIENSGRFSLIKRIEIIKSFFVRSMNGKGIIYPYWENVARGYEDIIAFLTVMAFLFIAYAVIIYVWLVIYLWRNKGYTMGDVFSGIKGMIEDARDKRYQKAYNASKKEKGEEL